MQRKVKTMSEGLWLCEKCGCVLFTNPDSHANLENGNYVECDGKFQKLDRCLSELAQVYNPKTKCYILIDKITGKIIHHKNRGGEYDYITVQEMGG
jgi:hypothetical protein